MSGDWKSATQFSLNVKENTKVVILVYPITRSEDYEKRVAACIVQHEHPTHQIVSFQQQGIGFASTKPLEFNMEPEFTYTVCPYATDESVYGDFGVAVFSNSKSGVECSEPKKWKYHAEADGKWKGKTAAGSSRPLENPMFALTPDGEGPQDVVVMLTQKSKDVSGSLFGDGNRCDP